MPPQKLPPRQLVYYTIKLRPPTATIMFENQVQRDELYLSANGRSSSAGKEAHLDSRELAEEFLDAYMPRLVKRHGKEVEAEVIEVFTRGYANRTMARIEQDSAMARKRLETGTLASNKSP